MLTNIFAVIGILAVIYFFLCVIKTYIEIKEDIEHLKKINGIIEEKDD